MSLTRLAVPPLILALIAAPVLALPTANAAVAPSGPTVTVSGTVTDTAGNPVAGASVHASRTQVYALTNSAGAYTLTGVPTRGSAEVVAAKEGFAFTSVVRDGTTGVSVGCRPRSQGASCRAPTADRRPFTNQAWQSLNGTWSLNFDPSTPTAGLPRRPSIHQDDSSPGTHPSLAFRRGGRATPPAGRIRHLNSSVRWSRGRPRPARQTGQRTRLMEQHSVLGLGRVWEDGALVPPEHRLRRHEEWVVDLGALAPGTTHTLVIELRFGHAASRQFAVPDRPTGRKEARAASGSPSGSSRSRPASSPARGRRRRHVQRVVPHAERRERDGQGAGQRPDQAGASGRRRPRPGRPAGRIRNGNADERRRPGPARDPAAQAVGHQAANLYTA